MSDLRRWIAPAYLIAALALSFAMPSSDSIWIDEAQTWKSAAIPDFTTWFHALCTNPFSEALMPLGMFFAWISAKVIGTSEWQLRAMNILWTDLGVIAFWRIGKALRAPWAPLLFAVQPFVWFYANEARPYSLQIACGAWILAGLVSGIEQRMFSRGPLLMIASAGFVLVGSTLFGIITLAAVGAVVLWLVCKQRVSISRDWVWVSAALVGGCILFGTYYFGALLRGAEGARLWSLGPGNVAFSVYEFTGLAGLGPPRDELRDLAQFSGISGAIRRTLPYAPGLLLLGGLLGLTIYGVTRHTKIETVRYCLISSGTVVGLVWTATVTLALLANFPFWGRHLAPSFAFYVGIVLPAAGVNGGGLARVRSLLLTALVILLLISSVRLRFASDHRKDDYRAAASIARDAMEKGESVWWVADVKAAEYYGLDFSGDGKNPTPIKAVEKPVPHQISDREPPSIIILSKPDVYDEAHAVRDLISSSRYEASERLKSFTIWKRGNRLSPL